MASPQFELHPGANSAFNSRADGLFGRLSTNQDPFPAHGEFTPELDVPIIGAADIIGEPRLGYADGQGRTSGLFFRKGDTFVGLVNAGFTAFEKVCTDMLRVEPFKSYVNKGWLQESLFSWIEAQVLQGRTVDACAFLLSKAEADVKMYEVWTPIGYTYVEHGFSIGMVNIRTITREVYSHWATSTAPPDPSERDTHDSYYAGRRSQLVGLAACVTTVQAENQKAAEVARQRSETALSLLRIFSPAMIIPHRRSYTAILGHSEPPSSESLLLLGGFPKQWNAQVVDKSPPSWTISSHDISYFRKFGIDALSEITSSARPSDFQSSLVSSLMLYSRSCLAQDREGRLIYVFAAIESLFLRNENEPIQQNVSERMVMLLEVNLDTRKKYKKLIKDAYGLRSSFFHHGQMLDSDTVLIDFLPVVWQVFLAAIAFHERFDTRLSFLEFLDDKKLQ